MSAALKTDEITSEGLAFVRGASAASIPAAEKSTPVANSPIEVSANQNQKPEPRAKPKATTSSRHPVLVGLSSRIDADLHEALMRASFERKIARIEPWTHQDILAEALAAWLKKAGYL